MVDCETLSTHTNATLLSIGACCFDIETGEVFSKFYQPVIRYNQNRHIKPETEKWWQKQSDAARQAAFDDPDAVTLRAALRFFSAWVDGVRGEFLWSFGATADITWLTSAYEDVGLPFPFLYRNLRCMRTLVNLPGAIPPPERTGIEHHALDDALHQANWVSLQWANLLTDKNYIDLLQHALIHREPVDLRCYNELVSDFRRLDEELNGHR